MVYAALLTVVSLRRLFVELLVSGPRTLSGSPYHATRHDVPHNVGDCANDISRINKLVTAGDAGSDANDARQELKAVVEASQG